MIRTRKKRSRHLPRRSSRRERTRSSCTRARLGCAGSRRAKTATFLRSTTIGRAAQGGAPDLVVVFDGGIGDLEQAAARLEVLDGIMMAGSLPGAVALVGGRSAAVRHARAVRYPEGGGRGPHSLYRAPSASEAPGFTPSRATSSVCFAARPGARAFRRHLATEAVKPGADAATFRAALALVPDANEPMAQVAAA